MWYTLKQKERKPPRKPSKLNERDMARIFAEGNPTCTPE